MMSRKRSLIRLLAAGVLSFGAIAHAHAVLIEDQVSPPGIGNFGVGTLSDGSFGELQQGVTAGIGGLLGRIELAFTGDLARNVPASETIDILFFVNLGSPWQNDPNAFETTRTFHGGETADTIVLDLLQGGDPWGDIPVSPGDPFVIGLRQITASDVIAAFNGSIPGAYPDGGLFLKGFPALDNQFDLSFVTFVEEMPVPEPSVPMLLILGLSGLGIVGRQRP